MDTSITIFLLAALVVTLAFLLCWKTRTKCLDSEKLLKLGKRALRHGDDQSLFDAIDHFITCTAKAADTLEIVEARKMLQQMDTFPELFVQITPRNAASADISMLDRTTYLAAFLLRRLEWIFQRALHNHVEPISEEVLKSYAKIGYTLAKFHPTLAFLPLGFLERSIETATLFDCEEVAGRAEVILSELIKSFIALSQEKQESYLELVLRALTHLERGVKISYKKNSGMGVALLMQPFAEIASILVEERYKTLPNRIEILAELKRILQQFGELEGESE